MPNKTFKTALLFVLTILIALTAIICTQSAAQGAEAGLVVKGYIKPGFANPGRDTISVILSGFNVTVEGLQASCTTDSNGYFEFRNIPQNTSGCTFKISKAGYLTRAISGITVKDNILLSSKDSPIDVWAGDFNEDTAINMMDIVRFTKAFNSTSSSDKYDLVLDVNKDGSINMKDIVIIAEHFNKAVSSYPSDVRPTVFYTSKPTATPTVVPTPTPVDVITGNVTYTLDKAASPTAEQQAAYNAITKAMDEAVWYYNHYTNITKKLYISYVPSVSTADGNINGSIRFGKKEYMNHITAMHEIAHTIGIGTSSQYKSLIKNGVFTGTNATNQLRAITGNPQDVLKGDSQHFWPYGLNYTSEVKSTDDLINHCKIVNAIKKDMGL